MSGTDIGYAATGAANLYMASAAEDLSELEGGKEGERAEGGGREGERLGIGRTRSLGLTRIGSVPTAIDLVAAHRDSPPGRRLPPVCVGAWSVWCCSRVRSSIARVAWSGNRAQRTATSPRQQTI
eukprot:2375560-Rhodomonas_salina.1